MTEQLRVPSYWLMRGRLEHVPLQRTTATKASACAASTPSIPATLAITFSPPTGQNLPSSEPAFTQASAKPLQPGKPHPPQLACGSTSATCPMRGSSYTANFLEATYRIAADTSAITPNEITAIRITFIVSLMFWYYSILLSRQTSTHGLYEERQFPLQPLPAEP